MEIAADMKNYDSVDVYIAKIPENCPIKEVSHSARQNEIAAVSNENQKREKYFVWKLLEYAVRDKYRCDILDMKLSKTQNGKWVSELCSLSISHSGGAVLVALAPHKLSVGADIELMSERRDPDALARRILSSEQLSEYGMKQNGEEKTEYLLSAWTSKEAVFKMKDLNAFLPSSFAPEQEHLRVESVILDKKKYIISVASAKAADIRFETVEKIFTAEM